MTYIKTLNEWVESMYESKAISKEFTRTVDKIRKELKREFPMWDFTLRGKVKRSNFTDGENITEKLTPQMTLTINEGPFRFSDELRYIEVIGSKQGKELRNLYATDKRGKGNNYAAETFEKILNILMGNLKRETLDTGVPLSEIKVFESPNFQINENEWFESIDEAKAQKVLIKDLKKEFKKALNVEVEGVSYYSSGPGFPVNFQFGKAFGKEWVDHAIVHVNLYDKKTMFTANMGVENPLPINGTTEPQPVSELTPENFKEIMPLIKKIADEQTKKYGF